MKKEDVVIVQCAYKAAALRFIVSAVQREQARRQSENETVSNRVGTPSRTAKPGLPEEPLARMIKRRGVAVTSGLAVGGFLATSLAEHQTPASFLLAGSLAGLFSSEVHYRSWTAGKTRVLFLAVQKELKELGASLNGLTTTTDAHLLSIGEGALKAEQVATFELTEAFVNRAFASKRQTADIEVDLETFVHAYSGPLKTIEQWPHLRGRDLQFLTGGLETGL